MSDFPQTNEAIKYTAQSYSDKGGLPADIREILANTLKTIQTLVDRPDDEKDALMAATALLLSQDITTYREAPESIENYSPQVQQIVGDAAAKLDSPDPYAGSADMMQIGLALAIGARGTVLSMYKTVKGQIKEVAEEDPRLLKTMRSQMEAVFAREPGYEEFFTGAQPRLEAGAQELIKEMKGVANDILNDFDKYTPPAAPGSKPGPKNRGKSFDL